jgi:hypothetical protein
MKPHQKEPAIFHDRAVAGYDLDLCEAIIGISNAAYVIAQDRDWLAARKAALQRRVEALRKQETPTP